MKKVGFVIPSFMYEILVGDMEYFRLKLNLKLLFGKNYIRKT